jgi:uncharacterized protein
MRGKTTQNRRERIEVSITFSVELRGLLHPVFRSCSRIDRQLDHHTSIKDLIESLRIPHTEIGILTVNGLQVDFSYRLKNSDRVQALSPTPGLNPCLPDLLRPNALSDIRFLADVNVAKLATLLRMVGIDCLSPPRLDDASLAETAVREGRILLTRDRNLLKRKIITHGHLIRSHLPEKQLSEILSLYGLHDKLHPFTRCMKCNTSLISVNKEDILDRLEPLTKKYYDTFFYCNGCKSIYWSGSHKSGMEETLAKTLSGLK